MAFINKIIPFIIVFAFFNITFFFLNHFTNEWLLDINVLKATNALCCFLAIVTFYIQQKALANSNPNVFIRCVMAVMMIKMFVCVFAVLAYVLSVGQSYSKPSIIAGIFLYLIYLMVEVKVLLNLNSQKNA